MAIIPLPINISSSGDNTIIAGVSGSSYLIHGLVLVAAGSVVVTVKNGSTALSGPLSLTVGNGITLNLSAASLWFQATSGNPFILNLSGNVQVSGMIYYQTQAS